LDFPIIWKQWMYHLSIQEPIVFLASVGDSFEKDGAATKGKSQYIWDEDFPDRWDGRFGHIMVCVGYDVRGGDTTFLVLNSWGADWGDRGYVHVKPRSLRWFCSEAYVLEPGAYPVPAPAPVIEERHAKDMGRDQRITGKLRLGDIHATDGIVLRSFGPSPDGKRQIIDYWDMNDPSHIETMSVLEGLPTTFKHYGHVYTFTYAGRGLFKGKPRFTLTHDDPENNVIQRRTESLYSPRVQ
ncbi:MAG TPA: C1 family peptidase, partial [Flavobacteriales bacterium]|nr:C1 family peptidase [Flavobacteriales bacterium]